MQVVVYILCPFWRAFENWYSQINFGDALLDNQEWGIEAEKPKILRITWENRNLPVQNKNTTLVWTSAWQFWDIFFFITWDITLEALVLAL